MSTQWHCTRDGAIEPCGDCDGCRYDTRLRLNALDGAAEVYAIAKFYADEGDDELLRRVRARIEAAGTKESSER